MDNQVDSRHRGEAATGVRSVESVHRSTTFHWVGNGFHVATYFPSEGLRSERVSPFVMMDYGPPKEFAPLSHGKRGVGWHPHRGFETVTLAWQGGVAHRDNAGHAGVIGPGDVQWMTAGRGIFHEEYHEDKLTRRGGNMHMMQLWVNLPRKDKTTPPAYQPITSADIPRVRLEGSGEVRVIAGAYEGTRGPAHTFTPLTMLDARVNAGGQLPIALPVTFNALAVVAQGRVRAAKVSASAGELILFANDGDRLELSADEGSHVIVLAGEPIDEPIAQYGPFVMNSFDEIQQAIADCRGGEVRADPGLKSHGRSSSDAVSLATADETVPENDSLTSCIPRGPMTPLAADFNLPSENHPAPEVKELPEAPAKTWGIIGPGLVSSGVGLASGEFVLWPFIASQVGLVFLWGAVLGVVIQWFLNLEIERYTLATGETALTGFSRMWKHWGLVFAVLVIFANAWPGWATSSATLVTFMISGNVAAIAATMLLAAGAILTLAPVVYTALERLITVKVIAIGGFFLLAIVLAINAESWAALPAAATHVGEIPQLDFALMMGAIAFAGAGGGQNLCQSNWIRDKGFGMGRHIQRLVSPVTGKEEAVCAARACVFALNDESLGRWRRWWRFANVEQALTFMLVTIATVVLTSMLAHSTLFGRPALPNSIEFLRMEGNRLKAVGGGWFGSLFWIIGAYSLFAATVGIIDYTARLAADVLKWTYLRESKLSESRLYFFIVWGIVAMGGSILFLGIRQPLVLLVISACTGGVMMFVYSILLVVLNRRTMPDALKTPAWRVVALLLSAAFFGYLSVLTIQQQIAKLLG